MAKVTRLDEVPVDNRVPFVRELLARLPPRHYATLKHITGFLHEVTTHAAENKCGPRGFRLPVGDGGVVTLGGPPG